MFFGNNNESVVLLRDVDCVTVPTGDATQLEAGSLVVITQALGRAFTVMMRGNLFRIDGDDADALGRPIPPMPPIPDHPNDDEVKAAIDFALHQVYDPEIPVDVKELGLIYRCDLEQVSADHREIEIDMTLTAPACGMGPILVHDVRSALMRIPTIRHVEINLVFDPPWSREMMSEAALLETGMM